LINLRTLKIAEKGEWKAQTCGLRLATTTTCRVTNADTNNLLFRTFVVHGCWYCRAGRERLPYTGTPMMNPKRTIEKRDLSIEEVRIVSDLRIMHAKVDELYHLVTALKARHDEADIVKYADQPILTEDIQKVDNLYLWFVKVKEENIAQRS
jgi:hypothetical protein